MDGAREVVKPEETGVLLSSGEVRGLAAAILRLLADPELRHRLGSTGRRRLAPLFDVRVMTAQIEEVYEELFHRKKPAEASS